MSPIPFLKIFRLVLKCFQKRVNAILTGTYIGKTYTEYRREFVEHFQYGKQIGKILDQQNMHKRHRAPKHILLGLESEKSGNQVRCFWKCWKYLKFVHGVSVHNGSDALPNELMRFRNEAKPIWDKIQKHCKPAVIN